MKKRELVDLIKKNIESYDEVDMNIFLAICTICDLDMYTIVTHKLPKDVKVSKVSCNLCSNKKSVLMFTLNIPVEHLNNKDN